MDGVEDLIVEYIQSDEGPVADRFFWFLYESGDVPILLARVLGFSFISPR